MKAFRGVEFGGCFQRNEYEVSAMEKKGGEFFFFNARGAIRVRWSELARGMSNQDPICLDLPYDNFDF
ncbi:hypothetical protein COLO4_07619 [Corchorus olitorius]|uniref:Uncharacterized protein n=1 Tax=Corchorus olitorius TaxID=93759 RepID=A0A1R3KJ43_9ROSI|nr:hypothetical protein COLO4_07619 [Corchorus olitorius]